MKHRSKKAPLRLQLPRITLREVLLYALLTLSFLFLNFALNEREPLSFALYFAALMQNLNPLVLSAAYLVASAAAVNAMATLSCFLQATLLCVVALIYRARRRKIGLEGFLFSFAAQIPFIFLFPSEGYALFPFAPVWQRVIIAAAIFCMSFLFCGGLKAILERAFKSRLTSVELVEISLIYTVIGIGILGSAGHSAFLCFALTILLIAAVALRSSLALPLAVVLSVPLAIVDLSLTPIAEFALYALMILLFSPYGKAASALALTFTYAAAQYFHGLYEATPLAIVFGLLAVGIPALLAVCIPERLYASLQKTLLFYRERTLPKAALNRNRRAVGERLFEVSALFREIECAFRKQNEHNVPEEEIAAKLYASLCMNCPHRPQCENKGATDSLHKLIKVGCAKGRVSLIDLPDDLTSVCNNSAGLLFALNKQLADYERVHIALQTAYEGRRLLAEQARGVSEILKELALEQSEQLPLSGEEHKLRRALEERGILCNELFFYGEGTDFTVSVTLTGEESGKKIASIASEALGIPLSLVEKLPLTKESAAFVLRKKPAFDAEFGVAAAVKEGESAGGDTHSILKLDERSFLVALSDGMGSGENARAVSDNTLSLLESFYKAKMPPETVLNTINRLIAYSNDETFACLDVAAVNLDTGLADIVKIGSPAGFVLSDELRVLEGESLPLGMLDAVHPATMRVQMKADDFLLFMSDGVTSAYGSTAELCSYLSALHPVNPQALAEDILSDALKRYREHAEDDMSVIAVKLTKAA